MDFSQMTLREKVLQTFVVTIREINRHGGPEAFFRKYPVGGMYFSQARAEDAETRTETGTSTCLSKVARCREAAAREGYFLLVCADSARIRGQQVSASTRSLGGSGRSEDAYDYGRIAGMQMNDNGIDWLLQPNTDLYYNRSMPFLAMTDDPQYNAEIFSQVIRGVQDQGVCATVKHFPGLGTTNINMHFAPGRNNLSQEEWMDSYGAGYRKCFEAGVCAVMTTHMTLKSFDDQGERGFAPITTFSSRLTTKLLKEQLGFPGVVVTDALIMGGMATGDLVEETVQAFRAGADMLLWPPVEAADRITELLMNGEIPMSRLEDALERIDRMRAFREKAIAAGLPEADVKFADNAGERIIRNGICCLRNHIQLLPLTGLKKVLIVNASAQAQGTEYLRQELEKRGIHADIRQDIYDVESRVCWQDDIDALQGNYDLVVFHVDTDLSTSWSVPFMLIWASHLFQKKQKLIINYGSPYFPIDYFPEDPTIIQVNSAPSYTAVKAVAEGIFGEIPFTGQSVLRRGEKDAD